MARGENDDDDDDSEEEDVSLEQWSILSLFEVDFYDWPSVAQDA